MVSMLDWNQRDHMKTEVILSQSLPQKSNLFHKDLLWCYCEFLEERQNNSKMKQTNKISPSTSVLEVASENTISG